MPILQFQPSAARQKRRKSIIRKRFAIIAVLFALVMVYGWQTRRDAADQPEKNENTHQSAAADTPAENKTGKLRTLSGTEFYELYQQIAYPNTKQLNDLPGITGNVHADNHIRELAEARGYELRSVPDAPIFKTNEPDLTEDDLLQQKALEAWRQLKKAAEADAIPLRLTSGYRSIEWQREFFVAALNNRGITNAQIVSGNADSALNDILRTVAVPGYSRHHTGYTIDLACDTIGLHAFKATKCYEWLSANNFENAKRTGWIPSYPDGTKSQGPDPEPWEYVWVGSDALTE